MPVLLLNISFNSQRDKRSLTAEEQDLFKPRSKSFHLDQAQVILYYKILQI